jgi:signal peptidase I
VIRGFGRVLFLVALGVGASWILRTFVYEPSIVESASMEPTLQTGVHYLVNRWVYYTHPPERLDLVSFISPIDGETRLVKRVIGIPGDRIELRKKRVILNGEPQDEPYAVYQRAHEALSGDTLEPLEVPPGMYFVLGDNRDVSEDSTAWVNLSTHERIYFLQRKNIKGRVVKL